MGASWQTGKRSAAQPQLSLTGGRTRGSASPCLRTERGGSAGGASHAEAAGHQVRSAIPGCAAQVRALLLSSRARCPSRPCSALQPASQNAAAQARLWAVPAPRPLPCKLSGWCAAPHHCASSRQPPVFPHPGSKPAPCSLLPALSCFVAPLTQHVSRDLHATQPVQVCMETYGLVQQAAQVVQCGQQKGTCQKALVVPRWSPLTNTRARPAGSGRAHRGSTAAAHPWWR